MQQFSLEDHPYITLDNLLKVEGWCESGARAKQVIADGQVSVDGNPETRKRCKIIAGQVVAYEGMQIRIK